MLQQMCRTCLATCGELVPIFSDEYYVRDLPNKLLHTIRIEVQKNDELPKMMCKKCVFLVDSMYCFKDQCEMAEIKLKKSLKSALPSIGNISQSSTNISDSNNRSHDGHKSGKLDDIGSDVASSSEEEYLVEYVSEEARREVENARKRSRSAKKKHKKNSGVKVKSVEILPTESRDNIYKNLTTGSSNKFDASEVQEDINLSDSDDRSSLYVSEESSKFSCNTVDNRNYSESYKKDRFQEKITGQSSKRKIESDSSYSHLSKVPKKVIFKASDYDNDDMHYMEITENNTNRTDQTTPIKIEENSQESFIENSPGKMMQNYVTRGPSRNSMNSLPTLDLPSIPPDENYNSTMESRMEILIKHAVLNFPEICAICSGSFETYLDVLKHKIESHLSMDQEYFFCPICHEKFYSNRSLVNHLNDHSDVYSFICVLCSGNFYTENTLRIHLQSHVDLYELKCEICSKKFQRIQNLLSHLEQHISPQQLICTLCSISFGSKEMLQSHVNKEHKRHLLDKNSKCDTCGQRMCKEELNEHIKNHSLHPCLHCERSFFTTKESLREHMLTHHCTQQFSCIVCEKVFNTKEERTRHMQEQHMNPQQQKQQQQQTAIQLQPTKGDRKKFRCRVCHEILISRYAYGQHLKEQHWNSKQTSEILRELSESSINEKMSEQFKSSATVVGVTPPTPDSLGST